MITPVKFPTPVSLSENPVLVCLKTNNNIISAGTKAKLVLHFNTIHYTGSGYQFRVSFGGNDYVFSMADVPDSSGLQFPIASQNPTDDNISWMKKIRDVLYANFYISELYDIGYTYNQVHITAKHSGTDYNITGQNISVPGLSVVAYAATNQQAREFFKIYLQVLANNEIKDDSLPVDATGMAVFNISEYLKPELSNTFSFPENVNQLLIKRENCCKDYSLRYCEYYSENGTPAMHLMTQKGPFKALTGGVSETTQALYHENNTNWYSQLLINHMFLTWHPGNKKTAQYDIQKLYYLVHTNLYAHTVPHVNLYATLNYINNGINYSTTFLKGSIQAIMHDVIEICCGYSRLGLDVDASSLPSGSIVKSYNVFLKDDAGNIVSEVRNFIFDAAHYEFYRQMIFRNSFGMYETIRFTAVQQRISDYENSVIDGIKPTDFTNKNTDVKKHKSIETSKFIINTGFVSEKEIEWCRELLLSKEVYEIKGNSLYAVTITNDSINQSKDDDTLFNLVIEYQHALKNQHYSGTKIYKNNIAPVPVVIYADHIIEHPVTPVIVNIDILAANNLTEHATQVKI